MSNKKNKNLMLESLLKKQKKIIESMPEMTDFIIGTIQYNLFFRCGNKNCKCHDKKNPQPHGPKTHLSLRSDKKKKNIYLKKERISNIRKFIENYDTLWSSMLKLSLINYEIYSLQEDLNNKKKEK